MLLWLFERVCNFEGIQIHARESAKTAKISPTQDLPVIIFSHGLVGMRTTCSSLCVQLASFGYVVIAVEHRDGTACMSISKDGTIISRIPYQIGNDEKISGNGGEKAKVWKKTAPTPFVAKFVGERAWRQRQSILRADEIQGAIDTVLGGPLDPEQIVWSSDQQVVAELFRNNFVSKPTICLIGHSFGACTALYVAAKDKRVTSCIALDPWMFPMPHLQSSRSNPCKVAIINSGRRAFQWNENVGAIRDHLQNNQMTDFSLWEFEDATHQDFSDLNCVMPKWIYKVTGRPSGKLDSQSAIFETVCACLKFLGNDQKHLDADEVWKEASKLPHLKKRSFDYLDVD